MVIEELGRNFVKCQIITGSKDQIGNSVLIPRIVLSAPDDQHIPLTRRQFPLRLGFSMTISKSQGQSLDVVGGYLPQDCFSHGQFYTLVGRATSQAGLKLYVKQAMGEPSMNNK